MSLEKRVERLESHFDSLDSAVRSLIKITGETHQLVLENQRENRMRFDLLERRLDQQDRRLDQQDRRMENMEFSITALAEATRAGFERADKRHDDFVKETRERFDQHDKRFDQHDKRFDQLELLIRQLIPNTNT